MVGRGYRDRIAASKSRLDDDMRTMASEAKRDGLTLDEFVEAMRERSIPANRDYAERLLDEAEPAPAAPRF